MSNLQSTHFYVENLSRFLSSFTQSNKKIKARCIKQKSQDRGPASAGVPIWLLLALCLRHLTLMGGEEEGAEVEVGCGGLSEVSAAAPPPLRSPVLSLPKHSSLALKQADSASFLSVLLLHTNRRNRSKGWSAPLQQRWQSCQRIPQSRTSISS